MRVMSHIGMRAKGWIVRDACWLRPIVGAVVGMLAPALVCYLAQAYPLQIEQAAYLHPSELIDPQVQASMGIVGAFLSAALAFDSIMRDSSLLRPAVLGAALLSVAIGCLVTPLCAAFPPLTAFMCWLYCPESMLFARGYENRLSMRLIRDALQGIIACIVMGMVDCWMMRSIELINGGVAGLAGVRGVVFSIGFILVCACGAQMARRRGSVQPIALVISCVSQFLMIWFWVAFSTWVLVWICVI